MPAKKKSSNKKPKATGYKVFTLDLPSKPKPKTMQQESERGRSKRRVVAKTAKKAKPKKEPKYKRYFIKQN
jgi:hypothetical protein